ncbi:MAG TPA: Nif3-like dinuclear metal center hexameric protein [Verrucomicrobiales bacterium]|jgi:dinuclear metal center YbgI/SA1388 family protein|nr:Nif3-like dinuclear metal center hexameric protein [Verrucomicrobiales bacterium]
MKAASLTHLVNHANRMLEIDAFEDYPGAVNGLQVENSGKVVRIAAAVDASLATIQRAAAVSASLLVVHHGLFWSPAVPWTGTKYQLIRRLLEGDIAVYSVHLPLDAHPRLGNNALLARALKLSRPQPFLPMKGRDIGIRGRLGISRSALLERLRMAVGGGAVKLLACGPERISSVGIVTGGAGGELKEAAAAGIDTYITGEGPHWTFPLAEELGVNVFYAGHYATETFGVKALAAELSTKFKVPWTFIDHPSGL